MKRECQGDSGPRNPESATEPSQASYGRPPAHDRGRFALDFPNQVWIVSDRPALHSTSGRRVVPPGPDAHITVRVVRMGRNAAREPYLGDVGGSWETSSPPGGYARLMAAGGIDTGRMEADSEAPVAARRRGLFRGGGVGLTGLALLGVILFSVTFAGLVTVIYLLPPEHLRIAELQPAVRVAQESEFPVGASRVVAWGDEPVLVVRGRERFYAVQGTSPYDGCILQWELESLQVVSPCTNVVYDLRGNVVTGLSLIPLKPYSAWVRRGTVYVAG